MADVARQIPSNHAPLRPLEIPSNNTDPESLYAMPMHHFKMVTSDVSGMASFMYAMADLVGDIRFDVTAERIRISERIARDNILVSLSMEAGVFDSYECTGDMVFCFQPAVMYKYISRHQTNSIMTWKLKPHAATNKELKAMYAEADNDDEYEHDRSGSNQDYFLRHTRTNYFLAVEIKSTEDNNISESVYQYYVPLLRSYRQAYKSSDMNMDYFLAIDSNMLTNQILTTFSSLQRELMSRYVCITCTPEDITFEMHGSPGSTITHAKFRSIICQDVTDSSPAPKRARRTKKNGGGSTEENNNGFDENIQRNEIQREVRAKYNLIYLTRLQRCFSINSEEINMYIKKEFPLIFDIKVGTLGSLRAVLMFKDDNDDEDEMLY